MAPHVLNESIIMFFKFFLLIFKHSQVALPLAEPDSETLSLVPLQLAFSPCLLSAVAYVEPVPAVNKIIRMYHAYVHEHVYMYLKNSSFLM